MATILPTDDRNAWALGLRIGTIVSVSGDATTMTVQIADGQLIDVSTLTSTTTAVGSLVALLLDRDTALVVGTIGPAGSGGGGSGTQGPQGAQGPQGPSGTTGTQGPQGAQGSTGTTGTTGTQGPQGTTGTPGAQGPQGLTGTSGATGTQGPQGTQGLKGDTGTTGTQGPQGATGTPGTTGTQGPQGAQGLTGTPGTQGPQGSTGTTGTQGPQGTQGTTGTPGTPGTAGAQGPQGTQGPAGPPYAMAAGTVTFPTSAVPATYDAPAVVTATINYPPGRFSVAPILTATPQTTDGTAVYVVRHYANTATGCTVALSTAQGAFPVAVTLSWIAVQMTASAAPGAMTGEVS
jgi:hypothetical protein